MAFPVGDYMICRTCLTEDGNMISISSTTKFDNSDRTICDIMQLCASVQVSVEDELPMQICLQCVNELKQSYLFRRLCEKSDATLRGLLSFTALDMEICVIEAGEDSETNLCEKSNATMSVPTLNTENCILEAKDGVETLLCEKSGTSDLKDYIVEIKEDIKTQSAPLKVHKLLESNKLSAFDHTKSGGNTSLDGKLDKPLHDNECPVQKPHKTVYSCWICRIIFITLDDYQKHILMHIENKDLQSENRLETNVSLQNTDKPERDKSMTVIRSYSCTKCKQIFATKEKLNHHSAIAHKAEKPFKCEECGKSYTRGNYLEAHKLTHTHNTFHCGECEKVFSKRSAYNAHSRIHIVKKFLCSVCGKRFTEQSLKLHEVEHTGEKPYKCELCNKSFCFQNNLIGHKHIHNGDMPVECLVCHKRYPDRAHLHQHMKIHPDVRPHECATCGKGFITKGALRRHEMVHMGERPYVCEMCGAPFRQDSSLKTHKKLVHKINK